MRHKFIETIKYIASIGNYHRELSCVSFLSAISVTDRLESHNEKVLYTAKLGVSDDICHMAYFKGRNNTETDIALFPFGFVHHPENRPLVFTKPIIKPSGFSYIVGFFNFPFKQSIHSTSLSFWLKQRLIKWVCFCPLNLKTLYSHFRLFYTAVVIDSNTLSCYPLVKRLEGIVDGKCVSEGNDRNGN